MLWGTGEEQDNQSLCYRNKIKIGIQNRATQYLQHIKIEFKIGIQNIATQNLQHIKIEFKKGNAISVTDHGV
jgi:hypothetical protein